MQFQSPTNPEQAAQQRIIVLSAEQRAEIARRSNEGEQRWEVIESIYPEIIGKVWCEVNGLRLVVNP